MKNAEDIFNFLDAVDAGESRRKIPTKTDLKRMREIEETKMKSEIEVLKRNIADYQEMKSRLERQKKEHMTSIMVIQADIDRAIKEKERLSGQIEKIANEIDELQKIVRHSMSAQLHTI